MADRRNTIFIPNLGAKPAHQIAQAAIMALIGADYASNALYWGHFVGLDTLTCPGLFGPSET